MLFTCNRDIFWHYCTDVLFGDNGIDIGPDIEIHNSKELHVLFLCRLYLMIGSNNSQLLKESELDCQLTKIVQVKL